MKSTLLFNELTCIDHAYIDSKGHIVGGSFMLSVILTGEVNEGEEVVLDFSKGKKQIKAAVDEHQNGFDHKLWVLNTSLGIVTDSIDDEYWLVVTPNVSLKVTSDSVRHVHCDYSIPELERELSRYLEEVLNKNGARYSITCKLSVQPVAAQPGMFMFRYAHGLPQSSSYGCQNIAHGHLSYFMLLDDKYNSLPREAFAESQDAAQRMLDLATKFDGMYFVHRENVVSSDNGGVAVKYSSERGKFEAVFAKGCRVTILDTDTTIEHLIEHMRPSFEFFKQIGAKYLMVSEGLAKGAITEITGG